MSAQTERYLNDSQCPLRLFRVNRISLQLDSWASLNFLSHTNLSIWVTLICLMKHDSRKKTERSDYFASERASTSIGLQKIKLCSNFEHLDNGYKHWNVKRECKSLLMWMPYRSWEIYHNINFKYIILISRCQLGEYLNTNVISCFQFYTTCMNSLKSYRVRIDLASQLALVISG